MVQGSGLDLHPCSVVLRFFREPMGWREGRWKREKEGKGREGEKAGGGREEKGRVGGRHWGMARQ